MVTELPATAVTNSRQSAPYRVLVIGAGRIGAMFDEPGADRVLTHAHAFSKHPRFRLAGMVDADFRQAEQAAQRWNCRPFRSLDEAFSQGDGVDVVVIATPDETHYPLLKELAEKPVKLVVAEKPLTKTVEQAGEILELYGNRNIPLVVNYNRRFASGFVSLRNDVRNGKFGRLLRGVGYYGKGITHNGSHMVDLLDYFFNPVRPVEVLERNNDFYEDDPTVSCRFVLGDEEADFTLLGVDCRHYTIFETEMFFEKARIRMTESGDFFEIYHVVDSPIFQGYRILDRCDTRKTGYDESFPRLAESVAAFLDRGEALPSTGASAFVSQTICNGLK